MREIVSKEGQTVMDITVQEYGSPTRAMDLVRDNNLAGITAFIPAGSVLRIQDNTNPVVSYFRDRLKVISSGPIAPEFRQTGIGFMQITGGSGSGISNPFIVS